MSAPLPSSLACWLHAAFPPRPDGSADTARIAAALEVAPATVRRWVRSEPAKLTTEQRAVLRRRAHLRGRGRLYYWPQVPADVLDSEAHATDEARHSLTVIRDHPSDAAEMWASRGWLDEHLVLILAAPTARVRQIMLTRAGDATSYRDYLRNATTPRVEVTVPNRQSALLVVHEVLARTGAYRCVVPAELVRGGRSYCWRADAPGIGPARLTQAATTALSPTL